ncbi:hypothetical protein EMO89_00260 [Bifidobacterium tissieri]|uniref:Uncharacterized protein n=1 Tax=Bifidobacterium tissieri TaxID=1630162 RepID=A0A5M9ZWG6_9BIFI|nr:hypothetical protein [Bifidobacterium tissieri]KAA8831997.1 hypothetical protein EMO89_00260 [Bifidobacterium tissieri]
MASVLGMTSVPGVANAPVGVPMPCLFGAWRWLVAVVCVAIIILAMMAQSLSWSRRVELRGEGRCEESERYRRRAWAALIIMFLCTITLGFTAVAPIPDPMLVATFLLTGAGVDILMMRSCMQAIRARCDDAYDAGYADGSRAAGRNQTPVPTDAQADKEPAAEPTDTFNE